jgi:hypothetical protein
MTNIKVLVWRNSDGTGDPEVEVKIPAAMARWVPRMVALVPKKSKAEVWGDGVDVDALFGNFEQLVTEAAQSGLKEILDVKSKDAHVKVLIDA